MSTEVFKVTLAEHEPGVCRGRINHISCIVGNTALGKYYTKGTPTRADIGGLLVFDTIANALRFLEIEFRHDPGVSLWRVNANTPVALSWRMQLSDIREGKDITGNEVDVYWKARKIVSSMRSWPPGTLAFKEVTLTEQLLGPGMEV